MNIALRKPRMTQAEFFDWADAREGRYEFDGFQPVAMVSGTRNHGRIAQNIYSALRHACAAAHAKWWDRTREWPRSAMPSATPTPW